MRNLISIGKYVALLIGIAAIYLIGSWPLSVLILVVVAAVGLLGDDPPPLRSDDVMHLQSIEEHCTEIAETAKIFIMSADPHGIINYINKHAEEISGYSRDEVIGRNFLDVFVPLEHRERVVREARQVINGEDIIGYESPILNKAGNTLDMIWTVSRTVDNEGRTTGYVSSGIDLTELHDVQAALSESEEMYRTLVEHNLAGVVILQDNRIVYTNKRVEEIYGYTFIEVKGMKIWDLAHPEDRPGLIERAARRLQGEQVSDRYEYRIVTKSGDARVVEAWTTSITYMGQESILATVIDITERRNAEEERLRQEMELEHHKHMFYSQTITSITQGKLEVLEPDQIGDEITGPQVTVNIENPQDASLSRHLIRQLAISVGFRGNRLGDFLLAVGEAAANVLKHAGKGVMYAGVKDGKIWVGVFDHGQGMDALILTQAVFRKGFSTKPSLGLGYTLILEYSDHVLLSTSQSGTTVVMEKSIEEQQETPIELSQMPDTW